MMSGPASWYRTKSFSTSSSGRSRQRWRAAGSSSTAFPRTLAQAELAFERARTIGATAEAVVYLAVPDDVVRERLRGARPTAGPTTQTPR